MKEDCMSEFFDKLDKMAETNQITQIIGLAITELSRARKLYPVFPDDKLQQIAIMTEESMEAQKAVLEHYLPDTNKTGDDPLKRRDEEIIQTVAMCLRVLLDG